MSDKFKDVAVEYDLNAIRPIEFKDIREGMLIMHKDHNMFYMGVAVTDERWNGEWVDVKGNPVADSECSNYVIPKHRPKLPTAGGSRIRLVKDHPKHNDWIGVATGYEAGDCYTFNEHSDIWILDGHSDGQKAGWFDGAEWEVVEVVGVE